MSLRPLSKELQEKAEMELNEVPSRIQEDLDHIKDWIKKQPHLNVRTDDQWLISFLRGCKYSLHRVKQKLDFFYTMRNLVPEFFSNRDPFLPENQELLKAGCVIALPKVKGAHGPRIVLLYFRSCDLSRTTLANMFKIYFMVADILMLEDDNCVVSGIHLWADYKGGTLEFLTQFTPSTVRRCILCLENAYPIRIKGAIYTNASPFFEKVFMLIKSLMKSKLQKRLHFFTEGNFDQVYEQFPKDILPVDMGGCCSSIEEMAAHWKEKIESYREWFLEDNKYCSDENKRIESLQTPLDLFGFEGAFRKLNID